MRKKYRKLRAAAVLLGMLYSLSFDWQICCIAADDSTWISLDNDDHWTHAAEAHACGKKYRAFSYDLSVEGYADRTLCCKWDSDPEDNIYGTSYLGVSRTFYSYSIIDRQGSPVFEEPDELLLSYSIDIGSIENKSQEANWKISTFIQCSCRKQENAASDLFGSSVLCNIEICDCSEGYSFAEGSTGSGSPVDLGTITADGVVYDVLLMNDDNSRISQMKVMRREKLAPSASGDIPEGCVRYENTVNMTDIYDQLKQICIDLDGISEGEFLFHSKDTSGTVYLNSADFLRVIPEDKIFSEDDCRLMQSYLLGKSKFPPDCEDYRSHDYTEMNLENYLCRMDKYYDLNGNGIWDAADLSLMKSRSIQSS